jgi:hypothetical protein
MESLYSFGIGIGMGFGMIFFVETGTRICTAFGKGKNRA